MKHIHTLLLSEYFGQHLVIPFYTYLIKTFKFGGWEYKTF